MEGGDPGRDAILVVALLWPSGEEPDTGESVVSISMPVEKEEPEKDELTIKAEQTTANARRFFRIPRNTFVTQEL